MTVKPSFRSGFVTIAGRPNVGKSTLINKLVDQKVAIVSDKPQTTRHKIMAVVNGIDSQLIFIDTPGLHRPKDSLGTRLNKVARVTFAEADVIVFMLDALSGIGAGDEFIARELAGIKRPVILVINKIDAIDKARLDKQENLAKGLGDFDQIVLISALKGEGTDELIERLDDLIDVGPQYFPDGMISDQPEKVLVAEFIREKVLAMTKEEIPYSVAVSIEEIKARKKKDLIDVRAWIYVERDSQKGILIGSGGEMIKAIGQESRIEIESILGSKIFLDLRVKVRKKWRRDDRVIDELGY